MSTLIKTCLFLFVFHLNSFSQNGTYQVDNFGRVRSFSVFNNFYRVTIYDYDFQKFDRIIDLQTVLSIDINDTGNGRLVIFNGEKYVFNIVSCIKKDDQFRFKLKNYLQEEVIATLILKDNAIFSFWLDNSKNNTAVVSF